MRKLPDKLFRQVNNTPRPKPRYSHNAFMSSEKIVPNAITSNRFLYTSTPVWK